MIRIRQPFYSIASSIVFTAHAILYGVNAINGVYFSIGNAMFSPSVTWAMSGLMFLMGYFSLVHIRD